MPAPPLTILMYHALLADPTASPHRVHIDVAQFAQQLAWLHAAGYEVITVAEWDRRRTQGPRPGPAVVLTFDDGYLSLLTRAAPLLQRYGFTATLFLTTGVVDQPDYAAAPTLARAVPPGERPLTWAEVRTLRDLGWDIQAHSCTHPAHAGLPAPELQMELLKSRRLIEQQLGTTVEFYAFPFGNYDRPALRTLHKVGYAAGFSVHGGPIDPDSDRRRLPRIEINTGCAPAVFARLVRTGYASAADQYRASLRNALFRFPLVKDLIQRAFGRLIN